MICQITDIGLQKFKNFNIFSATQSLAIRVYKFSTLGRGEDPLFDGTQVTTEDTNRNHYQPILNIFKATGSQGFCIPCNKSYKRPEKHRCSSKCSACFRVPMFTENVKVKYGDCLRTFMSLECFE